jgi:hypothetical protein
MTSEHHHGKDACKCHPEGGHEHDHDHDGGCSCGQGEDCKCKGGEDCDRKEERAAGRGHGCCGGRHRQ